MLLIGDFAIGGKQARLTYSATIILGNLEGPVLPRIHAFSAQPKAGPSLFSSELPNGNERFVFSLANNHIMDYGQPGLESTMATLEQKGCMSCGAGKDVHAARRPIIVQDNGTQVGIIACCEAQFGVARRNSVGVAEFGPWIYHAISHLRKTIDAVIVSVHAAVEDSPWPSPYIRELYQSFIDAGATIVHGHHAHIPQGYEEHGDGIIFYGMGNFAVDPERWREYPNGMWSLAAEVDLSSTPVHWRPLTLEIRHKIGSDAIVIEESNAVEQEIHRCYLNICNRPLDNPVLFEALWQEVALRIYFGRGGRDMGFSASPHGGRRRQVKVGLSMIKGALLNRVAQSRPSRHDHLVWYHMIACESHRQMLATALGVLGGEIKDLRTEETRRLADEMMPWSRSVRQM